MDAHVKIRVLEDRLLNVEQVIKNLQTWVTSISDKIGEEIPNIFRIQNDTEISNLFPLEDEFNEPSEDSFQDMVNEDVKPEVEELNPYKLKDCTVVLERLSEKTLEDHLRKSAVTQKLYSCPACPKFFLTGKALKAHNQQHHLKSKAYPCNFCHRVYYYRQLLASHIRKSHTQKDRYLTPCPVPGCNIRRGQRSLINHHIEKIHPDQVHLKLKIIPRSKLIIGDAGSVRVVPRKDHLKKAPRFTKQRQAVKYPHQCPDCDFSYKVIQNLEIHQEHAHRRSSEHLCPHCSKIYYHPHLLKVHINFTHIFNRSYPCPVQGCPQINSKKSGARKHLHRVHPEMDHLESQIKIKVTRKNAIESGGPEMVEKDGSTFENPGINPTIAEIPDETMIYAGIQGKKKFKCPILDCPVKISRRCNVNRHIDRVHPGEGHLKLKVNRRIRRKGPWSCPEPGCEEEFILNAELKLHQKLHSKTADVVSLPCEYCGILYKKESALQNHIREKHEDREEATEKYSCPEEGCGKEFGMKEYLKRHMQIHSDLRYTCEYCGVSYKQNQGLQVHLRHKHTENPEFRICPVCGLKLKTTSYSVHMHSHSGVTYSCEYCPKSFGKKSRRDFHQKCHLMPPEICKVCGVSMQKYRLMEHMRRVHSGSRFECQEEGCGKLFKTKSGLTRHKKRFH